MNQLEAAQGLGQSIWLDFIRRSLITGGQLQEMVREGVRGLTSNPSIFQKAISQYDDYDAAIRDILRAEPDITTQALYERLAVEDIRMTADLMRPVYEASGRADGLVSIEVSPRLAYDAAGTVDEARHLWRLVGRDNILIKVPATSEGVAAIETLIAGSVNVNATLIFSLGQYEAVARAYLRGLAANPDPGRVSSVASIFVSRLDTYVDRELEKIGTAAAQKLRGRASVANCRLAYRRFREIFTGPEFTAPRARGARVQRIVWGSTSTKNPAYRDVLYVEELIGRDTVNTVPPETLDAFRDHGRVRPALEEDIAGAQRVMADLEKLGINVAAITEQLQKDGVKAFADSFDQLLDALARKKQALA